MKRNGYHLAGLALGVALLAGAGGKAAAADPLVPRARGSLVFAGRGRRHGNAAVWGRYVELAGGKGAPIAVIPAASSDPLHGGQSIVDNLNRYGASAVLVPIGPRLPGGPA